MDKFSCGTEPKIKPKPIDGIGGGAVMAKTCSTFLYFRSFRIIRAIRAYRFPFGLPLAFSLLLLQYLFPLPFTDEEESACFGQQQVNFRVIGKPAAGDIIAEYSSYA
ncbi:unnamed protein product [Calypogeia fissa]